MGETTATAKLKVTFLGVATLLFDDGKDAILTDGFFTRPGYVSVFLSKIKSDEETVARCLKRADVGDRLRAVLVAHTHWDHALDSAAVSKQTGARLFGSESTCNVGRGYGLSEDQMAVLTDGQVLEFGAFRVTVFEGLHSPGDIAPGEISEPLRTPASYKQFKSSKCYSWLLEHGEQRVFVHPSANFVPGKFEGVGASTLFLGVGVIGKQSQEFRDEYWRQTVGMIAPKRIIPIHWDNFWVSLDKPLTPCPWPADKWSVTEPWLREKLKSAGHELYMPKAWEVFDDLAI